MTTMLVEPFPPWLRDINRFFSSEGGTMPSAFSPPADVIITDDGVTVAMDVPGIPADKLDIELENDVLTVRGERPNPYSDETPGAARCGGRSAASAGSSAACACPAVWTRTPSRPRSATGS